ncbi:MAG TPA: ABC-F family ATP-binding cassette domain-containing protein [Symbiobacteriaceae bacterium]|jgi:ATP-binding cassette subfamily F protein 3
MAILTVQALAKYWGVELLFKEVGFLLNEGEKMALVGRNGTGKTTLLKILMGRMEYDEGSVILPGGTRVGYLSQDPEFTPGRTMLAEAQSVFAYLAKWEQDLRKLEAGMGATASEEELQVLMDEYTRTTALYEAAGGYDAPARVKAVLFGLGFTELDLGKPVEVLSGGQKVRLGLAKLLLDEPDLMLLDEPTNHLDLEATEWLEGFFKNMKSAAILVSHDRYFLDKVITRTLEMENGSAEIFYGNYSYYLEEKKRRQEAALTTFERQQKEYAKLEAFYLKWRNTPSRKDQAQSRKKMMDRMELIERPKTRHKQVGLEFDMDYESGADVLKVENLSKAYGEKTVFRDINARLYKGDRVALVGPNGCGKTTFLKVINNLTPATSGTVFWGVGVQRGYFSQDLDALDYSRTCMEEMLEIPGFTKFDAHSLLGRFLFSGDDAYKPIAQCSGGERNRLILAKLMVAGANVLLLDEPTNHLDLESKMVLEESLTEYPGTVLFVSHDRYFVDQIATKVWVFSGDGIKEYEGNYSDYVAEKERLAAYTAAQVAQGAQEAPKPKPAEVARQEGTQASRARKEERKAAEALRRLEQEIHALEARKAELEGRMADPDIYKTASGRQAVGEYQSVQSDLERLYQEWEQAVG